MSWMLMSILASQDSKERMRQGWLLLHEGVQHNPQIMHSLEDCLIFYQVRGRILRRQGWFLRKFSGTSFGFSTFRAVLSHMASGTTKETKVFVKTVLPFLLGQLAIFTEFRREVGVRLLWLWRATFALQRAGGLIRVLLLGLWRTFSLIGLGVVQPKTCHHSWSPRIPSASQDLLVFRSQ